MERQMVTSIKDVEISHKARYFFASSFIKKGDRVFDACCGVGYGTKMMSDLTHAELIEGFDKSYDAIQIAKFDFSTDTTIFNCESIEEFEWEISFDIITCFEAIEHIENPELLIQKLCNALKPNGKLILSTPNERRMPWSKEKFPEHLRHFTEEQIFYMLETNGINNIIPYCQEKFSPCIKLGTEGKFMIFVGVKS